MKPATIDQISDRAIMIIWDDGHESIYFADHLRKHCPCALCNKEKEQKEAKPASPFKVEKVALEDVTFTSCRLIGRYAVGFHFSDGHKTGIYPYKKLRELCQCDLCSGNSIRIRGR